MATVTKFIEKTINGKDAALYVEIEIADECYIDLLEFEGCTKIEAFKWINENKADLYRSAEKQIEDDIDVPEAWELTELDSVLMS